MRIYSFHLWILIVDVVKDSLIEEFKVFNVKGVELLIEHIEDAYLLITQAHFYFELRNYNHFQINCLMDLLSINNIYIVYSDKFSKYDSIIFYYSYAEYMIILNLINLFTLIFWSFKTKRKLIMMISDAYANNPTTIILKWIFFQIG